MEEPEAGHDGAGWRGGNWKEYDREFCVDCHQLVLCQCDILDKRYAALLRHPRQRTGKELPFRGDLNF